MKKPFIIHPFLFAIYPVLFLFSHNVEQVSFHEILMPSAIILGFTLLLVLLASLILRDSKKAGIFVSVALILFFSYGHIYTMIHGWKIGSFIIGRPKYALIAWSMLFICVFYFIARTRRDLRNLMNILNVIAFSLVVIALVNIGVYKFKVRGDGRIILKDEEVSTIDSEDASILRDIYYIILDGYANSSILKEIYDYDNSEFTDYLTAKGFYIASDSRSNYGTTFLSLASSLNMEYLNYLSDRLGVKSKDLALPYRMVENNKVMNFLKSKGYKFVHFSSGSGETKRNYYADLDIQCGSGNEFLMVLVRTTILDPFEKHFGFIRGGIRKRIIDTFTRLAEVHKIKEPTFTFAHLLVPHPPFVFGANGEPVKEAKLKMHGDVWKQKENYLNQLIFVNKKVKVLIDKILINSDVPPIIILQADHGSASTFSDSDSGVWEPPTEDMIRERMSIFNAYYLPEGGNDPLYEFITPVNTFRLIFNFYFDTNYKLLKDQSYYSTYEYPYEFINGVRQSEL